MRISQYRNFDISNGIGVGTALFVQGCHFHCKGCFNASAWDFTGGVLYTNDLTSRILSDLLSPHIKRLSILGGEPLADENYQDVLELCKQVNKPIWLYTGYSYEELLATNKKDILRYIDYLVDGQYVDELKDLSLKFRGSSNQRVIDVKNSDSNRIVLLKEVDK